MISRNPGFLGQVPLHGVSFRLDEPSLGQEFWPDVSRRALEKFERAQEEGADDEELGALWEAYQEALNAEMNWLKRKFNFRPGYQSAYVPQGQMSQPYQSYANVRMTPTSPVSEPTPTTVYPPEFSDVGGATVVPPLPPPEAQSKASLPGAEQAQGLPCPPGQYRPPGAGWCVPRPSVQTGGPGGFGSFGAFGAAINMGPSSSVPFTMGRAMLGQVRLVKRPY